MSVSYNLDIPAANNAPSVDQPNMLINTNAVDTILAVDHVAFNVLNGGTHKQVTFSSENTPSAPTNPASVLYTTAGTASSNADMRFRNANGIFPVNLIRAYGVFDTNGATISSQSINISSSGFVSNQGYTLTLSANATNSADYAVFATGYSDSLNPAFAPVVKRTNTTTFIVAFRSVTNSVTGTVVQPAQGFSCIVLQL